MGAEVTVQNYVGKTAKSYATLVGTARALIPVKWMLVTVICPDMLKFAVALFT